MGKKFIDKKKAATFHLLARDTSDPVYYEGPENDRVFVRVDNNPVSISGLDDYHDDSSNYSGLSNDPNSIFVDAPGNVDSAGLSGGTRVMMHSVGSSTPLPDHMRREILELGFPDDGYNYLIHLREIRNTGGGSAYYDNPKANLHDLSHDVKAYYASRVRIREAIEDTSRETLYDVAEKTVNLRVQKAVDPEIAKVLDENDLDFGSDVEDLEEDFVVRANLSEEADQYAAGTSFTSVSEPLDEVLNDSDRVHGAHTEVASSVMVEVDGSVNEKPRVQHLLDQ